MEAYGGNEGDGGPRETGGATQNRVAAGSGSASRLSLAIALVRRVKVGINGRRTLLGYGRGDEDGGRGKGPSRSVAGAPTWWGDPPPSESQVGYQKRRN